MAKNKNKTKKIDSVFDNVKFDDLLVKEIDSDSILRNDDITNSDIKEVIINEEILIEQIPTKSKNETFFEKFEKTKKDFSKEKRKQIFTAKKNISTKFKSSSLSTKLNDSKFLKISWSIFICFGIFILSYCSTVLGFLAINFSGVSNPLSKWTYINVNLALTQLSVICSGIVLALVVIPYLYLVASWFVGINSVYKSSSFFIFNIICLIISAVCVILIVCTSSIVFNFVIGFNPIGA